MTVANVNLANTALAKLTRDGSIQSLEEKGSNARYMKHFMPEAIEEFIEEFDWPQCRVVQDLSAVAGIDTRGWTYAYQIPDDCVKVWRVNGLDPETLTSISWEMGMSSDMTSDRTYIYTNDSGMKLRFGSSRVTLERFTPKQRDLIAFKLAEKTCLLITKDKSLLKWLSDTYERRISAAKTSIANMEPEVIDTEFVPETIAVRR